MMNIGPPAQDQKNFVRISKFFSFYLDIQWNLSNPTHQAGLSIRGGTRYFYPPKMVFGTPWF